MTTPADPTPASVQPADPDEEPIAQRFLPALEERGLVVPLEDLAEFDGNPRLHDDPAICESLRVLGQIEPLIVNRGTHTGDGRTLISGHGRLRIMRRHGWTHVAVVEGDWTDADARKALMALNGSSRRATVDPDAAAAFMLPILDDLIGSTYELADLEDALSRRDAAIEDAVTARRDQEQDPDEVTTEWGQAPDPVCQPGDVVELGDHRLVIGDARLQSTWDLLLGATDTDGVGETLHAVWTDPPFGANLQGSRGGGKGSKSGRGTPTMDRRRAAGTRYQGGGIAGDDSGQAVREGKPTGAPAAALIELLRDAMGHALNRMRPGGVIYMCAGSAPAGLDAATTVAREQVWHRDTIAWVKHAHVMSMGDYHSRMELVLFGWKPGKGHRKLRDRKQDNVHEHRRPMSSELWEVQKPVDLVERHIRNHTARGDLVGDPFAGSGTTLIACERSGRAARLVEIEPAGGDVIARRWETYTGTEPLINGTPVSFAATTPATS